MNRAFEIRLYPNKEQKILIDRTFGACRFMYNSVLSLKQTYYKTYEFKDIFIIEMLKSENPWLKEIGSQAICQALNDLNSAYKNWFNSLKKKTKQKSKSPKFKKET